MNKASWLREFFLAVTTVLFLLSTQTLLAAPVRCSDPCSVSLLQQKSARQERTQRENSNSAIQPLTDAQQLQIASSALQHAFETWKANESRDPEVGIRIIKQLAVCCDVETAEQALAHPATQQSGITFDSVGVTSFSLRQRLLQAHMHVGNVERAVELANTPPTKTEQIDRYINTQYLLVKGYLRRGEIDKAIQVTDAIPKQVRSPDGGSKSTNYNKSLARLAIVQEYCNRGQHHQAALVADRISETPSDSASLANSIFQDKTFRDGPAAGFEFLKWVSPSGQWSSPCHIIADRLFSEERFADGMELKLLALPYRRGPEFDLRQTLRTLIIHDQDELANYVIARLQERLHATSEKQTQDQNAYAMAAILTTPDRYPQVFALVGGRGDGGRSEQEFLTKLERSFYSAVYKKRITLQQAVDWAGQLRTAEQKHKLLQEVVKSLLRTGRVVEARELIESHVPEEHCDSIRYAALFLGAVAFDALVDESESASRQNQLRYQRATNLISGGELERALEMIELLGTGDVEWAFEGLSDHALRIGEIEFAVQVIETSKTRRSPIAIHNRISTLATYLITNDRVEEAIHFIKYADERIPDWGDVKRLQYIHRYPRSNNHRLRKSLERLSQVRDDAQYDRLLAYLFARIGNTEKAWQHCQAAKPKPDSDQSMQYKDLGNWNPLISALNSGEQEQIWLAIQLQRKSIGKLLELDAATANLEIETTIASILKIDDPNFRVLALQKLATRVTPKLAIFNYYYNQ